MRLGGQYIAAVLAAGLLLAGCEDSKHDILGKAENVSNKAQLMEALGKPDDLSKMGPIETWTYKASNGEVTFLITGDAVALTTTGNSSKKQ